jgi:hypothetical protein
MQAFTACWLLTAPVNAHPQSISTVEVQIQKHGAKVSLTLQTRDLNSWFPPGNHADYKSYVLSGLKEQAPDLFEFQVDGQEAAASDITVHGDKPGCVRVDFLLTFPSSTQLIVIRSKNLDKLPSGHQQLLCAEDERAVAKPGDPSQVVLEQPLNAEQDFAEIQIPDAPSPAATSQPAN